MALPKIELTPEQRERLDEIQAGHADETRIKVSRPASPGPSLVPTYREVEILSLIADGLSHAEIGKRLFISPETVRTHRRSFRRKVGAATTPNAIAIAFRLGLIE
jgi:DNA-binding CsgD family transcriptional regulator